MPTTISTTNGSKIVEWGDVVHDKGVQYGLLNALGIFDERPASAFSVDFDKNTKDTTLLPRVNRQVFEKTGIQGGEVDTFSLALPHFYGEVTITSQDIQDYRKPGMTEGQTLEAVYDEKLTEAREIADMTKEYMKVQAVKGVTKAPDGSVIADMFTEFGVTQPTLPMDFATTTSVAAKLNQLNRLVNQNFRVGGVRGRIMVLCDGDFFDALTTHADVENAWANYENAGKQRLRDDPFNDMGFSVFNHRGIDFVAYDAVFNLPNGTTEAAIEPGTGYVVLPQARKMYRGYNGPSRKVAMANKPGQDVFVWEDVDTSGDYVKFGVEFSSLYFTTSPLTAIKLTA